MMYRGFNSLGTHTKGNPLIVWCVHWEVVMVVLAVGLLSMYIVFIHGHKR